METSIHINTLIQTYGHFLTARVFFKLHFEMLCYNVFCLESFIQQTLSSGISMQRTTQDYCIRSDLKN